jgi:hypothetical protein
MISFVPNKFIHCTYHEASQNFCLFVAFYMRIDTLFNKSKLYFNLLV